MTHVTRRYRMAQAAYARIEKRLLSDHEGEFVAVDPDSGEYVVGRDEMKVTLEALRRHPKKKFGFFCVGRPVVHKLRSVCGRC